MEAVITYIAIIATLIVALITTKIRPAGLFSVALLACWALGYIDTETLTGNIANHGLLTLLLLVSVSLALERTAALRRMSVRIVSSNYPKTLLNLTLVSGLSSAFLNNTAVVSTLTGVVKKTAIHPSQRLLIPLSYAAILGGTITLVGTSTNLIINSFYQKQTGVGLAMFDFALIGIPATFAGIATLLITNRLLPGAPDKQQSSNQYLTEVVVSDDSNLIGRSVEDNGLRHLAGLFLVEIVRADTIVAPVEPQHKIEARDRLIFTGDMSKVMQLNEFHGLEMFANSNGLLRSNVTEVILAHTSELINKTLKSVGFRARFDAAVVAVHRNGVQLSGKLGEILLQTGDRLVLATGESFKSGKNLENNFYFVSDHSVQRPYSKWQELAIYAGFSSVIVMAVLELVPLLQGLLFLLAALMLSSIITAADVKQRFPFDLLVIIVSALGLANAFEGAGLTLVMSDWFLAHREVSPYMALVGVYLLTVLTTETITNNAAAALMFPLGYGIAVSLGVDAMPFVMAVAFGASASFISPYSYQTNLIVMNAGQYQFKHFLIAGIPISIVYSSVVLFLLPRVYSF